MAARKPSKAELNRIARSRDSYGELIEMVLNRLKSATSEQAELIARLTAQAARLGALAAMGTDVTRDVIALKAAVSNLTAGELRAIRETVLSWIHGTVVASITSAIGE